MQAVLPGCIPFQQFNFKWNAIKSSLYGTAQALEFLYTIGAIHIHVHPGKPLELETTKKMFLSKTAKTKLSYLVSTIR